MNVSFADENVSVSFLEAGRVRVSSSSNVTVNVTTKDGVLATTDNQRNEFTVRRSYAMNVDFSSLKFG